MGYADRESIAEIIRWFRFHSSLAIFIHRVDIVDHHPDNCFMSLVKSCFGVDSSPTERLATSP